MSYVYSLFLITGIYLVVLASPGPNFFILSQMALNQRYREACYVALGISTGSIFWVVTALAGITTLLTQHPWLASGLRVAGAGYLLWYGGRLLWSAFHPTFRAAIVQPQMNGSRLTAYRTGLLTGVTNPKGAAFWTSAFAAVFPVAAPSWFYPVTVLLIGSLSLGWHVGIILVFGSSTLRAFYLRTERTINGCAGTALIALGLQRVFAR